jgi:hypothetical protein
MALDLSPYRIAANEKPASAAKQNNMLWVVQGNLNLLPPFQIQGYPADATKYLNGAGGWTAPAVNAALPTLRTKLTQKEVINTLAKTDLLNGEITIPANSMSAQGAIRFWMNGDYVNNTATYQTIQLELKLGTTVLWDSGVSSQIGYGVTSRAWYCEGLIQAMNSTSVQRGGGFFTLGPMKATTVGVGGIGDIGGNSAGGSYQHIGHFDTAAGAVPMNATQAFTFSVTHSSASASLTIRLDYARFEVV